MKLTTIVTAASAALLAGPALAQPFEINWYTIDCGGGTSAGGAFELSGTIGQHDTGVSVGGVFELAGGFWASGLGDVGCPADLDGDGDADADDFFAYLDAFAGGNVSVCDIDGDGDCDADDFFGYLDLFAQGC